MLRITRLLAVLVTLICGARSLASSEESASAEAAHDPKDFRKHHAVALFLGATDEAQHDTEFTVGLDYAYCAFPRWCFGGVVDYAGGGVRNTVLAAGAWFKPGGHWVLLAAPGIESHNGSGDDGHGHVDKDHTEFLLRLGVLYEFPLGRQFHVAPTLDLDFVHREAVFVYGVNFIYTFRHARH